MRPLPFKKLLNWVLQEIQQHNSIFGIPRAKFYTQSPQGDLTLFGEKLDSPLGPAAGPHTQLAQNITAAYLAGGRFFELKTVQILDSLEFPKPCINAQDEGYNTEWSTELSIQEAFAEYVKAWIMLHFLQKEIFGRDGRGFIFNISVGYDLKGIKSPGVNEFIEGMIDASGTAIFRECIAALTELSDGFDRVDAAYIAGISPKIASSVTVSTLHGCPPQEIEAIAGYLLEEKRLNTFVKMNPTLLGYDFVRNTLERMGYNYINLKEESFTHDLQYDDGVQMLKILKNLAALKKREFGVKLSNTLPVKNTAAELPGEEMYLSGRALYPLTINLAWQLAREFNGDLKISYSGGADFFNLQDILQTGIAPVTVATTLLKPGGYLRLFQLAGAISPLAGQNQIDLAKLEALAQFALNDPHHQKNRRPVKTRKLSTPLPLFDCFTAPCTQGCPIGQDIPRYIRLVAEGRYREAYAVIVAANPLPMITGTICNHNCTTKCTRIDYDEPLKIREIKRIAAEKGGREYLAAPKAPWPAIQTKVAVIGAGPSGLAAGYFLARAGLDVTVFDADRRPGGIVAQAIPDFRLNPSAIESDLELIKSAGVKFELGVDPNFSLQELKVRGYKYIYLGLGAGKGRELTLENDGSAGVLNAVSFLKALKDHPEQLSPGRRVAVVGGGNSAMDAARAAKRIKGVEEVVILYRRTRDYMPADREELEQALEEGIRLKELVAPVSLKDRVLKCQKMTLGEPDSSGRRSPVPLGETWEYIAVDTVLAAVGEELNREVLERNQVALDRQGKVVHNHQTNETNQENVFIGGDALTGPATVVEAIAGARKAARAIIAREGLSEPSIEDANGEEKVSRKGNLQSYTTAEAEPARCLECNAACNICSEVCPNRANVVIKVPGMTDPSQIIHLDGLCNECGNCATFCPYQGAPYRDKLTLFDNEDDFRSSDHDGFCLLSPGSTPEFQVRIAGQSGKIKLGLAAEKGQSKLETVLRAVYTQYSYLLFPDLSL